MNMDPNSAPDPIIFVIDLQPYKKPTKNYFSLWKYIYIIFHF
jgi:hypothetical protein